MEIRVLNYFLTIIREGSISRAAKKLHITQPTLSRQIKELEDELNTILFTRGNINISLTDDGLLLKRRAEEILMLVNKTQGDFLNKNTVSGDIYIGCGETDGMRLISRVALGLQRDFPNIKVNLMSGNSDDITEKLDKGILDFCILIEPTDKSKYDFIKLPTVDNWGLLIRKDSFLANKTGISPEDLIDLPILTSRQTLVWNEFSSWLGFDSERLNIVWRKHSPLSTSCSEFLKRLQKQISFFYDN